MSARGYKDRLIDRFHIYGPHARSALQSAEIYSSSSATFTPPNTDIRAARILLKTGGNALIEIGVNPSDCDVASTELPNPSGSENEYGILLDPGEKIKIAGLTEAITFQLTWFD